MKNALIGAAVLACISLGAPGFTQNGVQVTVNGQPVNFDQPPVMQGGRVLVPLRGVFERLGATVIYNAASRSITAQTPSSNIALQIGSTAASVNGQQRSLDSAPIMVGARAMVPLRFVSEALGAGVNWNPQQGLVAITSGGPVGQQAMPPTENNYAPPEHYHGNNGYESNPVISQVSVNAGGNRRLHAGDSMHVTLRGTPGGQATFDVNGQTGFPLAEQSQGVYTGEYTVRNSDINNNAVVTGHLSMPNGRTAALNADRTVVLEGNDRGEGDRDHRPVEAGRLIQSVVHNGNGTISFGQELRITMTGRPGGLATFDIGGRLGQPMQEVAPGTYIGTYRVQLGEINPNAQILVHLTDRNGQTASMVAPPSVALFGAPR